MRSVKTIVFASTNRGKFEEFEAILKAYPEAHLAPVQEFLRNAGKLGKVENFSTYAENAAAKARVVNQGTHYPTLADDSGIEIDALNGAPGVRSNRFAVPQAGVPQDLANVNRVLNELKSVAAPKRTAKFVTEVVLVVEGLSIRARGELEGTIAESPMGQNGFGYDSIFIPKGYQKTLAQMTLEEKNRISHRNQAIHALMKELTTKGIYFVKP